MVLLIILVKEVIYDSFFKGFFEGEDVKEFDFCMCNLLFFVSEFEVFYGVVRSDKRF